MNSRLDLHDELLEFLDKVYFQPPSNIQLQHPCIIYHKSPSFRRHGDDRIYIHQNVYQLTVIETDPDSTVGDDIEKYFQYCSITQRFTQDNLHHTVLRLYF